MSHVRAFLGAVAGTALAVLAVVGVETSGAGAGTPPDTRYVALGDSYTAGPLIMPMNDAFVCARSARDYPALLAARLQVQQFTDVSCSSATTRDFGSPQPGNVSGTNAPQYDALTRGTTLVTVGIGGNDIGLVGLAESCLNVLPHRSESPARRGTRPAVSTCTRRRSQRSRPPTAR